MLLVLLGGVDPSAGAAGHGHRGGDLLAAGSLGGLIALWRDRTFQSLALTVLFWCYICAWCAAWACFRP